METSAAVPPQIEQIHGAQLGRTAYSPALRLFAAELVLPRPMRRDETAITEFVLSGTEEEAEVRSVRFVAERRISSAIMWARFHSAAVPRTCWAMTQPVGGMPGRTARGLAGRSAHAIVHDFGPGVCGLHWEWR